MVSEISGKSKLFIRVFGFNILNIGLVKIFVNSKNKMVGRCNC